jgi:hypothetical protein
VLTATVAAAASTTTAIHTGRRLLHDGLLGN